MYCTHSTTNKRLHPSSPILSHPLAETFTNISPCRSLEHKSRTLLYRQKALWISHELSLVLLKILAAGTGRSRRPTLMVSSLVCTDVITRHSFHAIIAFSSFQSLAHSFSLILWNGCHSTESYRPLSVNSTTSKIIEDCYLVRRIKLWNIDNSLFAYSSSICFIYPLYHSCLNKSLVFH